MLEEFRFRVDLYTRWDLHLAERTRFFAAAAATNAMLVKLCTTYRFCISRPTLDFLSSVGATLQGVNLETAHCIAAGGLGGPDLDDSIVLLEQTVLELELRNLADSNCHAHRVTVRQIDRLLNCLRLRIAVGGLNCPGLRVYSDVLQNVARELGRPATFALRRDRVCIGQTLIRQLRDRAQTACRSLS